MTAAVWLFVVTLNLPSFGGEVTFTARATSYEACERLRAVVIERWVGDERNIKGTVTRCTLAAPVAPPEPQP